jgi:AraC-like DNA-binding protein
MKRATYTTLPGLRLTRRGGHEVELFRDHSDSRSLKGFSRIFHDDRDGKIDFQYYIGERFQIWQSYYLMQEKLHGESEGDIAMLELHLPLLGDPVSWWDGHKENWLRKHQFELGYLPYVNGETIFLAGQPYLTLDVHYEELFLKDFAERFPILGDFLLKVEGRERANLLNNAVRFLSPSMLAIVHDIQHYRGTPEFAALYFHECVSLLLEAVLERAMVIKHEYSTKKYLDAAVSVRELVERHPTLVHTGKSLSAHTGINVSLLHKIFREYNGTSLFDFSQGVRLDHAKVMLRDTPLLIFDVAQECGYTEHANFTAAFRKRFGYTPQEYRDALAK